MMSQKQIKESLNPSQKMDRLVTLRAECYSCTRCDLCNTVPPVTGENKHPHVFSSGKITSKIMLVGQNPGLTEVQQGRPFVGAAGRVLDKALEQAGMSRKSVFVTNGVLCYTSGNTLPPDESVEACRYYLSSQIEILRPDTIVVMGKSAARSFGFGDKFSVAMCKSNRKWETFLHTNVLFTVHPAYTIYSKSGFDILVDTFKLVRDAV